MNSETLKQIRQLGAEARQLIGTPACISYKYGTTAEKQMGQAIANHHDNNFPYISLARRKLALQQGNGQEEMGWD